MTHNFKGFAAAGFDLVGFTLRRKFILINSNRHLMKHGCSRCEEGSSGAGYEDEHAERCIRGRRSGARKFT
jgi:hypothetical protein